MSTAEVPSANLYIPQTFPFRTTFGELATSSFTLNAQLAPESSSAVIILGLDMVAAHFEPVQCFVEFQVPYGTSIYYDSQSTGEGLGVRFNWRGQTVSLPSEHVGVFFTASGSIDFYGSIWGLLTPFPVYV